MGQPDAPHVIWLYLMNSNLIPLRCPDLKSAHERVCYIRDAIQDCAKLGPQMGRWLYFTPTTPDAAPHVGVFTGYIQGWLIAEQTPESEQERMVKAIEKLSDVHPPCGGEK